MKFRYFIPTFMAIFAMLVSCSEDKSPTFLNEVRVSSSYVTFPQEGGTSAISITATDSWSIAAESIPSWLTISPSSGGVGTSSISFTVDNTDEVRECELKINCGGEVQRVNVLQSAAETEPVLMTVSEAVATIKAGAMSTKAVYVKGIVCKIQEISVQYGNATYYISDDGSFKDGNWLQIYRGYWINAAKFTKGDEFSVGDEMVISGVLIDYNGTPETQQGTAEVISITKSLLKVDSLTVGEETTNILPVDGGEIVAHLTSKGTGVAIEIPAEAQSWLGVVSSTVGENPTVTFRAAANAGGDRKTTVTFKTTDGSKEYTAQAEIVQNGAIVEVSIGDFLAAEVGDTQFRLTGVITELYTSDKQGKSFYIADHTGSVLVYRAEGFIEAGAKVGDVVTVVGKRGAYKDTPQLVNGTFEVLKYPVKEVSIADFRNLADNKEAYYLITGTISKVKEADLGAKDDVEKYGNFDLTDASGSVYVYGVLKGWGGPKGQFGDLGLTWGDKLTIIAYKTTYKGLVEAVGVYVSHEKAN